MHGNRLTLYLIISTDTLSIGNNILNINNLKNMKQSLFMAGTLDEVSIGDIISASFSKELGGGKKYHRTYTFEVTPKTIPMALELNIIEVKDEKGKDVEDMCFNFDDLHKDSSEETIEKTCDFIDELMEQLQELNNVIDKFNKKKD